MEVEEEPGDSNDAISNRGLLESGMCLTQAFTH